MRNMTTISDVIEKIKDRGQEAQVPRTGPKILNDPAQNLLDLFLDVYQQKAKQTIDLARKRAQTGEACTLAERKEIFLSEIIKGSHRLCQELEREHISARRFCHDLRQMLETFGQLDQELADLLK